MTKILNLRNQDLAAIAHAGLMPGASVSKLSKFGIRNVPDFLGAAEASPDALRQVVGWSEQRLLRVLGVVRRRAGGDVLCAHRLPTATAFPMGCQADCKPEGLVQTTRTTTTHPVLAQARRMVEVEGLPNSVEHPGSEIRQQREGSCVGQAMASFLEPYCGRPLSPLFLYRLSQREDGLEGDVGSRPMTAARILKNIGCCSAASYPRPEHRQLSYTDLPDPDEGARVEARRFRVADFVALESLDDLLAILAFGNGQGMRVPIGIRMFQSSVGNPRVAETGDLLERLGEKDRYVGNHEILVTGYERTTGRLHFQNSWGPSWGRGGCGTLSFQYFRAHAISAIMLVPEPTYSKPLSRARDLGVLLQRVGTFMGGGSRDAWPFVVMAIAATALTGLFWPSSNQLSQAPASHRAALARIPETGKVDLPNRVQIDRPPFEFSQTETRLPHRSPPSQNIYLNLLREVEEMAAEYPELIPDLIRMREDLAIRGHEWMKAEQLLRMAKDFE